MDLTFASAYRHGFARVAACAMPSTVADPQANADAVIRHARACHDDAVAVAALPELTLTGYAVDDLLLADALLDDVLDALARVVQATADLMPVVVVGAPLRHAHRIYNCAVVVHRGQILGVAPKSYLPTYREFYERRQMAPGDDRAGQSIEMFGTDVPFGPDLLFAATDVPGLVVHVEVCEDMWVPVPPSAEASLAGATVLVNISGSPITIGRAESRALLARAASLRCVGAYVYAAGGEGESTTDLAWDGQTMIHELGAQLVAGERFARGDHRVTADVDLGAIRAERLRMGTFDDNRRHLADLRASGGRGAADGFRTVAFALKPPATDIGLRRIVERFPFVPSDPERLAQDCYEAYSIQVAGLEQRLAAIGDAKVVIGVSGGLDSTHALIVAARAMDRAGRPRSDILAFTLPGFATSEHTKANATALASALGVTFEEIDITAAARQMLADLGHRFAEGEPVYDVTFENVQAGLRTDYLFRAANQRGGIVLGTGDLSEIALGWSTYGVGDQMSHYNVNAGVPKTLIQHLIGWVVATEQFDQDVSETLSAILDTEISPELVPAAEGQGPQSTEDRIGPFALQDFTLFHTLRHGRTPSTIAFLAWHAWHDVDAGPWPPHVSAQRRRAFDLPVIKHWLGVFVERFFAFSQFKRSAMPNGPKVSGGGSLSPRGDWRAPSDASARVWADDVDRIPNTLAP